MLVKKSDNGENIFSLAFANPSEVPERFRLYYVDFSRPAGCGTDGSAAVTDTGEKQVCAEPYRARRGLVFQAAERKLEGAYLQTQSRSGNALAVLPEANSTVG